jgi:hypothetical protein
MCLGVIGFSAAGILSDGMVEAADGAARRSIRLKNGGKTKSLQKAMNPSRQPCHRIGVADSGSFMKRIG